MTKPGMTQREVDENAARAREQREEREAAADKAEVQAKDEQSSKSDEIAKLRAELEDIREKMALKDLEYQRKKEAWLNGDFSSFREDHPFNILVQTGHDVASSLPVKQCVNGEWFTIKRGQWVRVPHKVVHALGNEVVNAEQQIVGDDGHPYNTVILRTRHPFSALPLECLRQDEGECACEPAEKTVERRAQKKIAIAA